MAVCGFDVAGEIALRLALLAPEVYGQAILECIGLTAWRDVNAMARNDVSFFLFTRQSDKNHEAMTTLKDEMQRKGLSITFDEIPGGHKDDGGRGARPRLRLDGLAEPALAGS